MQQLSAAQWEARYQAGDIPWDLNGPTPELQHWLEAPEFQRIGAALVPGAGRGHDALLLARKGWSTAVVDFAPTALRAVQEAGSRLPLLAYRMDFFALPAIGAHQEAYDLLWEYTFFCAIDPALRPQYAAAAAALLKPGGRLLGLFFPTESTKEGPPFVVSKAEVEAVFSPYFKLSFKDPEASVKPRAGREFLGIFTRL